MKLPFYSDEYEGEFVIHNITIKDGKRTEDREWVPRTVTNDDHRGFAFVIGNGTGRTMQGFDIKMIENHSGGLLVRNEIHKLMVVTHCIEILKQIF